MLRTGIGHKASANPDLWWYGCKASASHVIAEKLRQALEKNKITDKVDVITTGCFGFCEKGPIVKIIPDNTFYTQVAPEDADEIIGKHIIGGQKVERLLYTDPKTEKAVSDSKHMDFYRKQMRIALRNCGFIDPENIEEYIALNGYRALAESLLTKKPEEVIEAIKSSGLRWMLAEAVSPPERNGNLPPISKRI